jgi:hypothetical protein
MTAAHLPIETRSVRGRRTRRPVNGAPRPSRRPTRRPMVAHMESSTRLARCGIPDRS